MNVTCSERVTLARPSAYHRATLRVPAEQATVSGVREGDGAPSTPSLLILCMPIHYGLLWATGFVPAENGGAPEIFKTSWGLDRQ